MSSSWSRSAKALLGLLAVLAMTSAPQALAAERNPYIVVFEDSVSRPGTVARAQAKRHDGRLGFIYSTGLKGYSATLPKDELEALRKDPRVKAVRSDHVVVPAVQSIPTGIKRVFAHTNKMLHVDEADNFKVDADVAIIDTGIAKHSDLNLLEQVYCNKEGEASTCKEKTGTDEVGHGTHVAGTAGAIDNGEGVVGVAPGVRLWSVKVLDPAASESELIAGVNWVTSKAATIEVANMSIGCETLPCSLPTMGEAITASVKAGVVYAVAAGNNDGDASESTFGTNPDVITVSALADFDGLPGGKAGETTCRTKYEEEWGPHEDDTNALFSNYGEDVEIAAPGVCILSTVPGGYAEIPWWGTSMASPHVAGAAAILAAQENPNSKADVEKIGSRILAEGNFGWEDNSGDEILEPLLDLNDETVFKLVQGLWLVGGTLNPAENEAFTGLKGSTEIVLAWSALKISCAHTSVTGNLMPGWTATAKVTFTGCKSNLKLCPVQETIVTNVKVRITLLNYIVLEPAEGKVFTEVIIGSEECALPPKIKVTGSIGGFANGTVLEFSKSIAETLEKAGHIGGLFFGTSKGYLENMKIEVSTSKGVVATF